MTPRPILETPRLVLRPFALADAPAVQRLAGAREVAAATLHIPHPYEDGMAEEWIESHQERFDAGRLVNFAMTLRETGALCGSIGLTVDPQYAHAELGYWLGLPFWGRGYGTEAARAVVGYGFGARDLHRVHASHFACNPASGRVIQKIGMKPEGVQGDHVRKWGQFHDLVLYGLLAYEWRAEQANNREEDGAGAAKHVPPARDVAHGSAAP